MSMAYPSSPRAAARQARATRLSEALKANLRRRKEQARERAEEADQPAPGAAVKTREQDS
jgi:hypothetical protein